MATDNFNRALNADLAAGAPIAWTGVESPDSNALRVGSANDMQAISALSGGSIFGGYATDPGVTSNDQSSLLEFVSILDAARSGVGVRLSGAGANAVTGYIAIFDGTDIRLYKYVAQDTRDLALPGTLLGTAATTLSAGDTMLVQAVGTEVAVRKNGSPIIVATDAAIATGGAGLVVLANSNALTRAASWDNFVGADNPAAVVSGVGGIVNTGLSVSRKLILSLSGLGRHRRM